MKIIVNPDEDAREEALKQLKANDYYCPCALEKTDDVRCMCKYFTEHEDGLCSCGLYIKIQD